MTSPDLTHPHSLTAQSGQTNHHLSLPTADKSDECVHVLSVWQWRRASCNCPCIFFWSNVCDLHSRFIVASRVGPVHPLSFCRLLRACAMCKRTSSDRNSPSSRATAQPARKEPRQRARRLPKQAAVAATAAGSSNAPGDARRWLPGGARVPQPALGCVACTVNLCVKCRKPVAEGGWDHVGYCDSMLPPVSG